MTKQRHDQPRRGRGAGPAIKEELSRASGKIDGGYSWPNVSRAVRRMSLDGELERHALAVLFGLQDVCVREPSLVATEGGRCLVARWCDEEAGVHTRLTFLVDRVVEIEIRGAGAIVKPVIGWHMKRVILAEAERQKALTLADTRDRDVVVKASDKQPAKSRAGLGKGKRAPADGNLVEVPCGCGCGKMATRRPRELARPGRNGRAFVDKHHYYAWNRRQKKFNPEFSAAGARGK